MRNTKDQAMRTLAQRRALLKPIAEAKGLDYNSELLELSTGETARVLQLLSCGADLLLDLSFDFPSLDRKTRKRGSKALDQNLESPSAVQASSFLAQGVGTLLIELDDAGTNSSEYRRYVDQLQSVCPITEADLQALRDGCAEFEVMRSHQIRSDLISGTGYHAALERGEDPDSDPELVQVQGAYAAGHLINAADRYAIELVAGNGFRGKLVHSESLNPDNLPKLGRRRAAWSEQTRWWRNWVSPEPMSRQDFAELLMR